MTNTQFKEGAEIVIFSTTWEAIQKEFVFEFWSYGGKCKMEGMQCKITTTIPTGLLIRPKKKGFTSFERQTIQIYWHQIQLIEEVQF